MAFLPALTASLTLHPTHAVPMAGHECQTGVNAMSVSLNKLVELGLAVLSEGKLIEQ